MATTAGPPQPDPDVFVEQFLRDHPDLTAGEASRQAYHAAHRIGLPAMYVEARVYDARKKEAKAERQRTADVAHETRESALAWANLSIEDKQEFATEVEWGIV